MSSSLLEQVRRGCREVARRALFVEIRNGGEVNALMLDNFLWHRGQEPYYRATPRHRTRTVFY